MHATANPAAADRHAARSAFAAMALTDGQADATEARLFAIDLESQRDALLRFARALLRDDAAAEDAVQETLLAALDAPVRFGGRSSLKTWLHGILKHKIADLYRRQARTVSLATLDADGDEDGALDALFSADGHWREPPAPWRDPETALSQRRFLQTLEGCIAELPANCARVFTMRELMGLEIEEICAALGITANHCSVLLHRARMRLRLLLEQRWFGGTVATAAR